MLCLLHLQDTQWSVFNTTTHYYFNTILYHKIYLTKQELGEGDVNNFNLMNSNTNKIPFTAIGVMTEMDIITKTI